MRAQVACSLTRAAWSNLDIFNMHCLHHWREQMLLQILRAIVPSQVWKGSLGAQGSGENVHICFPVSSPHTPGAIHSL